MNPNPKNAIFNRKYSTIIVLKNIGLRGPLIQSYLDLVHGLKNIRIDMLPSRGEPMMSEIFNHAG
jgi:hypothetical protein